MSPIEKLMDTVGAYIGLAPRPCAHRWRPARTSRGPARYCDRCEAIEQLTDAEFFAHFGTVAATVAGNGGGMFR